MAAMLRHRGRDGCVAIRMVVKAPRLERNVSQREGGFTLSHFVSLLPPPKCPSNLGANSRFANAQKLFECFRQLLAAFRRESCIWFRTAAGGRREGGKKKKKVPNLRRLSFGAGSYSETRDESIQLHTNYSRLVVVARFLAQCSLAEAQTRSAPVPSLSLSACGRLV